MINQRCWAPCSFEDDDDDDESDDDDDVHQYANQDAIELQKIDGSVVFPQIAGHFRH